MLWLMGELSNGVRQHWASDPDAQLGSREKFGPTRINLEEPIRVASTTRINLEGPGQGGQPNQDKVVSLSVCLSVCV